MKDKNTDVIEEQEYTFINETIKKKRPLVMRIVLKVIYILLIGAAFVAGTVILLYSFDKNIKDFFYSESETETTEYIELTKEDNDETEIINVDDIKSNIDSMMVTVIGIYYKDVDEETTGIDMLYGNEKIAVYDESEETPGISDQHEVNNSTEETETIGEVVAETETMSVEKSDSVIEERNLYSGVIISKQQNVYVLSSYEEISNYDDIKVAFYDGSEADASIYNVDKVNNIAVLKIKKSNIDNEVLENIKEASIFSMDNIEKGDDIIYRGVPFGETECYFHGQLRSKNTEIIKYDTYLRGILSDIKMESVDDGFLFNEHGKLIGIVMNLWQDKEISKNISAVSLWDLYTNINNLLNNIPINRIGIKGETVTSEMIELAGYEMPKGLYITDVSRDFSAYSAGLMKGDIIVEMDGKNIETMEELKNILDKSQTGDIVTIVLDRRIGTEYNEIQLKVTVSAE